MSISLNANFELLSAGLYLDARQQFNTLIEMKDFAETSIPDGFITYNKETQKHYVFSSSNTVDATLGKWREYNSGNSSTYPTWNSNVDYKVGNVVLKDEVRYSCIADHTSTDFETDSINWVAVLEQYYHVTQEQYNKMVSDGLITDSTKDLYIIDGNNEGDNSSANYTSLEALGLTADATIQGVIDALPIGCTAILRTDEFANWSTLFNGIQYGYLKIEKTVGDMSNIELQEVVTPNRSYFGQQSGGKFDKWKQMITESSNTDPYTCTKYTVLTGTEDLFTLPCGHYASPKADPTYNYPVADSSLLAHIYVLGCLNDPTNNKGYRIILYFDNKNRMYRINEWWGNFTNNGWQEISSRSNIYYNINQLNSAKGTSIQLVNGEDNTLKIVEALGDGEEFTQWYNNNSAMERFGIPNEFGHKITYLRIVKMDAQYALIIATTSRGFTFSRVYNVGVLEDWCWDRTKATLVANTTTLKLDVTKRNSGWYGAIKLTYLYDTSPVEVEISFKGATDDLRWAVINGQKYINKITFTQDSSNTAHYTIGIEFAGTVYGCHQAEIIGGFADINSLTKDSFTGDKTAIYYSPWGKNNGVTLVSAPEDLGLTYPCTTVQLVQAMRNKFNKTIHGGAIGVFNRGGESYAISDTPIDFGLLHIETFGHDRVLIRFDGIAGSNYAGSWIGQIKGNNGTFSGITWQKMGNKDVAKTALTVKVQTIADGSNFYIVKNGVCYVNYYFAVKNAESAGAIIFENLPKPAETMNVTLGSAWAEVRANSTNLYITGTLGANASCVGSFSYPVAD